MEKHDLDLLMKKFPDIVDTVENTTLTKLIMPE